MNQANRGDSESLLIPGITWLGGLLSILLGCTVMIGWHIHSASLTQVLSVNEPMQYNTALCFVICGSGLLFASIRWFPLCRLCGALSLLIASLTGAQYLWGFNLGLDQLLTEGHIHTNTTYPGRMGPKSTLAFSLMGVTLLIYKNNRLHELTLATIGSLASLVMMLGAAPLVVSICGMHMGDSQDQFARIGVHTFTGLTLLGVSVLAAVWLQEYRRDKVIPRFLPFQLGLAGVAFSVLLWMGLLEHETTNLNRLAVKTTEGYARRVETALNEQTNALIRMARRWEQEGGTDRVRFEADAGWYVSHFSAYHAIEYVDADHQTRWVVQGKSNDTDHPEDSVSRFVRLEAQQRARLGREVSISRSFDLDGADTCFLICVPLYPAEEFSGTLVGVINIDRLMDASRDLDQLLSYHLLDEGRIVYRLEHMPIGRSRPFIADMHMGDHVWQLQAWPTNDYIAAHTTITPTVDLMCGLIVSLGLVVLASLMRRTQLYGKALEKQQGDLRLSEERCALMLAGSSDGFWDWPDVNQKAQWWSDRWYEILGYEPGEITPSIGNFKKLLHPEDTEATTRAIENCFEHNTPFKMEYRLHCKDGSYKWIRSRGILVRDEAGNPKRMAGSLQDIHESRLAREALARSEERFTLAVEGCRDGIWDWNVKTDEVYYSPRFKELLGYEPDEFSNHFRTFQIHLNPEDELRVLEAIQQHLENREPYDISHRLRTKAGNYRWFRARGQAIWDKTGEPLRMAGSITDIHDYKQALEDLEAARLQTQQFAHEIALINRDLEDSIDQAQLMASEAKQASKSKSEFLANMSHEIRTPMNAIVGFSEILLNSELNEQQAEQVAIISSSAQSLLNLINDILDLSKVESKQIEFEETDFELKSLLNECLSMVSTRLTDKPVDLIPDYAPEIPEVCVGDPHRIRQVLLNLLSNAAKFTEKGSITLKVDISDEHDVERPTFFFSVIDTGIGIPPEKQPQVFEAFKQVDGSTTRKYGGTGLGLSIVRKLVEAMGGTIGLESEPGEGSTFHFHIPLKIGKAQAKQDTVTESLQVETGTLASGEGYAILVAEDYLPNQILIREVLTAAGYEVTIAENGRTCVEKVKENHYDLILMDMQMPVMDGLEATRTIRELGYTLPIVALTANAMSEHEEQCRQAGMDDYLTKPFQREQSLARIEKWLYRSSPAGNRAGI